MQEQKQVGTRGTWLQDSWVTYTWQAVALLIAVCIPLGGATLGVALLVLIAPLLIGEARHRGVDPWGSMMVPLLVLAGVAALSAILGKVPRSGLIFAVGLLLLGGTSLIGGRRVAQDPPFVRRFFLPALVLSTVAISVYVLYQYFGLHVPRATGLTSYTNRTGTLLLFSGLLGSGYLLSLSGRARWTAAPYAGLVTLAVATTLSRAAWIAALVGAAILALRWRRQGVIFLLLALLLGGTLFAAQPAWQSRFLSAFDVERNMNRLIMWDAAVDIFLDHPVLGTGPTSFATVAPAYIDEPNWRPHATPHNMVLTMAAEMGLAGLLALAWLGIRLARSAAALWHLGDPFSWGLVATLAALFVNDLFGQGFYTSQVGVVLWLTMGMLDGRAQGREEGTPPGSTAPSTGRQALRDG